MNTRSKIRKAILEQQKPFSNNDLVCRLKPISKDKEFILDVLDELYGEGLVDYTMQNNGMWAWIIV